MSFELNRQSSTYKSYASVLHLSIGGKSWSVGDRTPSIWFHPRVGVYIVTTLNGEANVGKKFRSHKPTIGEWTSFEISQTKKSSTFTFSVTIAGKEVWSEENGKPADFGAVRVYGSSPWYEAQAGSIRGLLIENKQLGKIKQCKKTSCLNFLLQSNRKNGAHGENGPSARLPVVRGPELDLVPAVSRPSTVTRSAWERRWSLRIATQPIVHGVSGRHALHLVARAPK